MKRQPMEWEKMFASHISDKGLISKIYKKHRTQYWKQKQIPKTLNLIFEKSEDLNRYFSKEGI